MKHAVLIGALATPFAFGLACPTLAQIVGTFSATLSGFQPTPGYSQLSVSNVSSRVALPVGMLVVIYNTGASAAYVALGDSTVTATTTAGDVIQPNSWAAFAVGSNTYVAGVVSSGAASLTISGGTGLPTAGGGGIPTGSAGSPNANVVSVQGVSGSIALPVTGTFWQATQPVSLAAIPSGTNTIGTVNLGVLNGAATAANQPALNVDGGALAHMTNFPALQAVSAAALPLPSNAAQETGGNLAAVATNTSRISAGTSASSALPIQGVSGGVAVPVSGTFWQATQPVSAASLPLPAGAATGANQPTKAVIGSTTSGQTGNLQMAGVTASAPAYTSGQTDPLSLDTSGNLRVNCMTGCSGSNNIAQFGGSNVVTGTGASGAGVPRVTVSNDSVVGLSSSSPGGALVNPAYEYITDGTSIASVKPASTAAATTDKSLVVQINPQQTPAVSLSQIDGSTTATSATGVQEVGIVGHAGASLDATLSPGGAPANMVVGGLQHNSSAPMVGNGQTVALQGDSSGNLNVNVASAIPSGTNTIGTVNLGALNGAATATNQPALNGDGGALAHVTNFPALQAVSATALPLPSNAAQETGGNLATVATNTTRISAGTSASSALPIQGVSGGVAIPVSGTFWQTTQPVSLASLPALASGSNVIGAVTQSGGPWTVSWSGQSVSVSSLPALASGASTIGKVDILGNAGATVDTAAGVSAAQALGIQGVTGGVAVPVSGTFWQATQPVSAASLPLPAGAATGANQPTKAVIGSTTSGQTGNLQMGGVTASAPAYTSGQTDPLSLDMSGNLRVNCTTGCSGSNDIAQFGGSNVVTGTGASGPGVPRVTVSNDSVVGLAAGSNAVGKVDLLGNGGAAMDVAQGGGTAATAALQIGCVYNASPPALTSGQGGAVQCDSSGRQIVTVANANPNGQQTMSNSSPVAIASNQSAIPVNLQLQTSNGLTKAIRIGITNGAVQVFSGQHQLMKVDCDNNNTALTYLQMFDATAGVSVGATTPSDFKPLQPNLGGGWMASLVGAQYSTGLVVAASTGPVNGIAPATSAINCSFFYN